MATRRRGSRGPTAVERLGALRTIVFGWIEEQGAIARIVRIRVQRQLAMRRLQRKGKIEGRARGKSRGKARGARPGWPRRRS